MFNGKPVIDVHGHMSVPPQFRAFAYNLVALRSPGDELVITDEQMKPPLDRHLRLLDRCNIDLQLISPRPVAMMHWERPFLQHAWTRTTNDIIAQQCRSHPTRFAGIAQLAQSPDHPISDSLGELERCVGEHGFVGAILNPDPSGDRRSMGVNDPYWFPLYKKAEELNATLIVHPSSSRDPRIEVIASNYQINNIIEETIATMLYEQSDVFDHFPTLRIVVCHCGGSLRRLLMKNKPVDAVAQAHGHDNIVRDSGEESGGGTGMNRKRAVRKRVDTANNLFFDTCAYDPNFLATAIKQRGVAQMVFGTEVPGTGTSLFNSQINAAADDVLAIIDSFDFLTAEDKTAIVTDNPLRVFPLLAKSPALQKKSA
jgi:predicted TIM-barrel fold metal-dependent hydrolase